MTPDSNGTATGPEAVDQQQLSDTGGASNPNIWQSFTPAVTGLLTKASLKLATATTNVNIYLGEGVGGTLLHTELSVSFIDAATVTTFSLSVGVPLESGVQYTIEAVGTQFARHDSNNPYAGGRSGILAAIDLVFETFMIPIETDFIVDFQGNIGIGVTPDLGVKLQLDGDSVFDGNTLDLRGPSVPTTFGLDFQIRFGRFGASG